MQGCNLCTTLTLFWNKVKGQNNHPETVATSFKAICQSTQRQNVG